MNTAPKPNFSISAVYLGPVFSLHGDLTKYGQNLIFARNGAGKSFLSRALRYLDLYSQGKDISKAANNLVSDESTEGKGSFTLLRGTSLMGELKLEKSGDNVSANVSDTIFYVFSEDFVHEELRERQYEIDGEIENQIAVDSDNIKLDDAQKANNNAMAEEHTATTALSEKFENGKLEELHGKAAINKNLKEYKSLNLERLLELYPDKPDPPSKSFATTLVDLDSLKAIPAEPVYPETVDEISSDDIDLGALVGSLKKPTSPSSVSEGIKKKIDAHHGFYEAGTKIIQEEPHSECPFCEQGITGSDPKAIIDAYINYFSAEEEKHKSELRDFFLKLKQKEGEFNQAETQFARQNSRYDGLKRYIPSKKNSEINDGETALSAAREMISAIKESLTQKAEALAISIPPPTGDLSKYIAAINTVITENNTKVAALTRAVEKADDERKALQRTACTVFEHEFAVENWSDIEVLKTLNKYVKSKQMELSALEKASPSKNARDRVAETFDLLLREFFADKYVFDKNKFVLRRGEQEMVRGPHRTLSDGEKTAIAFCYFVACMHRKVTSDSDYRKLYLVFDDPVTSMSYDFVFSIAQTLKNLNISNKGEVSINPGKIDGTKCLRPELLILTHSSYFFNISRTNAVIKRDATFSLHTDGTTHSLIHLNDYVAPFEQQLEHIYQVANGSDPDHGTGNAIRSVLEAVGRFCRPDKSQDLQNFITFLAGEEGLTIKSVMINSLCHGTYFDETPPPDDLKLACNETLVVVERFAIGHLELIKKKDELKGK